MAEYRVVLCDDHVVLRVGMRSFLEEQHDPPIRVVGEASTGEEAVELVERVAPHLLLLDLSMPGIGGIGTILELRRRGRPVKILVLTQHAESAHLRRALEAGAQGFVLKTARGEDLLAAIRAVLAGGTWIDPTMAGSLVEQMLSPDAPASDQAALDRLTTREKQVLTLVAEGLTNKEIADSLGIAVKTVMAHRANLMEKLGVHNHSKLVRFAIRVGLLNVE